MVRIIVVRITIREIVIIADASVEGFTVLDCNAGAKIIANIMVRPCGVFKTDGSRGLGASC